MNGLYLPLHSARSSDPSTSHAAARRAKDFASSHAGRIVSALETYGYLNANGIAAKTGLTVVQVDRRMVELQRQGLALVVQRDGKDLVSQGMRVWEAL